MSRSLRAPTVIERASPAPGSGDLDLDVGGEKGQVLGRALDQHVGEDRQRVAPLDDAADRGKRCQNIVAFGFNHLLSALYKFLVVTNKAARNGG
jgi:hypothetical protein